MLTRSERVSRNLRRERRLWHDESRNMPSLGCFACRERELCGLLHTEAGLFDCLQFCCGNAETCDRVCRNHPDYVDRVREIGGFALHNVPRAARLDGPTLPLVIPVIFHGNRRVLPAPSRLVALPLYRMFDRRSGRPRFPNHAALCANFGIEPGASIVLTGTDQDPPLERWWGFGANARRALIRAFKAAGVSLATTPNYSMFLDRPRWDDLHAMKRIAIVHEEFLSEGLPAALHVNGRTDNDFRRWGAYLAIRPEITHLCYEFTTGTGRAGRREQHSTWLVSLAAAAGRPLHLITRGSTEVLPALSAAFSNVTILDTSIFMKTMMRRRAVPAKQSRLSWTRSPTAIGAPLDDLFAENLAAVDRWFANIGTLPDGTELQPA